VAVGGLDDVLQLGLFGGQGVEVGIRLGVGGVDLVERASSVLDLAHASSTLPRTSLLSSSCGSWGR
jgi:hypothetical protein